MTARSRIGVALGCVLVALLCLPVLVDRVAAERSTGTVELAVPDSVLRDWGKDVSYDRLRAAGVSTVLVGMRFDERTDAPLGYARQRLTALRAADQRVVLALPHVLPKREPLAWLTNELARAISISDADMVVSLGDPLPFGESPDRLDSFVDFLAGHDLLLGLSDLARPAGQAGYVERLPGAVVRAHFLNIGPSSDLASASVQAHRAAKERGVRFVSVQPPRPDIPLPFDTVTDLTERISTGLPDGLRTGPATPMPSVEPAGPLGLLSPFAVQVLALGVAVAGATFAVWCVFGARPLGIWSGYGLAVLVTVTTGLVIAALATRSVFLVGGEPFRGVKLLLLAPPFVLAVVGIWQHRGRIRAARWRPAFALVALAVLLAAGIYLVRSGNSGYAPGFELAVRDGLDQTLYSRPRFKEVFLGYPALVLALGLRNEWRRLAAALAAVGTAGTVDTFAHFHTPLLVSLLRTGYAVVIGLGLGLLALWVVRRFQTFRKLRKGST
jgi:hypothetical protein